MKNTILRNLLVGGVWVAMAQTAFCQGTVYTSRSAFESALSSSTTITFENLPATVNEPIGLPSVTTSGVTFSSTDFHLYVTGPGGYYPIPGDGKYLWHYDGLFPITISVPDGVTAFGADFSGGVEPYPSFNGTLTVNLVGGGSYDYNFSAPRGSWTFLGVTFPEPIVNVVYRDFDPPDGQNLHEEMLDNVIFGMAIPEPGTLSLLGLGALLIGGRFLCKK